MDSKQQSQIQEALVELYLRLNGFFVTRFIVHSPIHGRNRTEIDALAVRNPFSAEPEREVGTDAPLDLSEKYTELVLCEVKSKGQLLQFNQALSSDPTALATVIRWAGLFPDAEVNDLACALCAKLKSNGLPKDTPATLCTTRDVRIRAILFVPERDSRRSNQAWFIPGPQILQYVRKCLCPTAPRTSCATTYDLRLWGEHEPIVRYFKSRDASSAIDMRSLYAFLESNGP